MKSFLTRQRLNRRIYLALKALTAICKSLDPFFYVCAFVQVYYKQPPLDKYEETLASISIVFKFRIHINHKYSLFTTAESKKFYLSIRIYIVSVPSHHNQSANNVSPNYSTTFTVTLACPILGLFPS